MGFTPIREIIWDADAILLTGPAPTLVIDENDNVEIQRNVSFTETADRFIVHDIANEQPGMATFTAAYYDALTNGYVDGEISGSSSLFDFRETYDRVRLKPISKDLEINGIDVLNDALPGDVTIDVDIVDFTFDVEHSFRPTQIDIGNIATSGNPDVIFSGEIDNPIGLTSIRNTRGDVLTTSGNVVRNECLRC